MVKQKKVVDVVVEDIRKLLGSDGLVFGTELAVKNLKLGRVSKVFVSSNCPESVRKDLEYYAGLSGAKVFVLELPNDELGVVCKKPFSVSVLSLLKQQNSTS